MEKYCLTYFLVEFDENNFDKKEFCDKLGFTYEYVDYWGTESTIEIGRNEFYDDDINVMIRRSIKDLIGKEKALLELKEKFNLTYKLERVPILIKNKKIRQNLSLDDDIIEFMYKTKTSDDLDYFID